MFNVGRGGFLSYWERARESFMVAIAAEFGGNFGGELDADKRHRERWEGSTWISKGPVILLERCFS